MKTAEVEYDEGKYNAKTFIAKLYEETDDPHDIHRAMVEEASRIQKKLKQKKSILRTLEGRCTAKKREENRWKNVMENFYFGTNDIFIIIV